VARQIAERDIRQAVIIEGGGGHGFLILFAELDARGH
jgi:hypothetical protein